jgi:hypothetical protein
LPRAGRRIRRMANLAGSGPTDRQGGVHRIRRSCSTRKAPPESVTISLATRPDSPSPRGHLPDVIPSEWTASDVPAAQCQNVIGTGVVIRRTRWGIRPGKLGEMIQLARVIHMGGGIGGEFPMPHGAQNPRRESGFGIV